MAHYNCGDCGFDGQAAWKARFACPRCANTTQVGVAIAGWELDGIGFPSLPPKVVESGRRPKPRAGTRQVVLVWETAKRTINGVRALATLSRRRPDPSISLK